MFSRGKKKPNCDLLKVVNRSINSSGKIPSEESFHRNAYIEMLQSKSFYRNASIQMLYQNPVRLPAGGISQFRHVIINQTVNGTQLAALLVDLLT